MSGAQPPILPGGSRQGLSAEVQACLLPGAQDPDQGGLRAQVLHCHQQEVQPGPQAGGSRAVVLELLASSLTFPLDLRSVTMFPHPAKCAMTSLTRSAAASPPPSPSMWTRRTALAPLAGSVPPPPGRSARTSKRTWPGKPLRRNATLSTWRSAPSPAAVDTTKILCMHDKIQQRQ